MRFIKPLTRIRERIFKSSRLISFSGKIFLKKGKKIENIKSE